MVTAVDAKAVTATISSKAFIWKLKRGSVYVTLGRMAEKGFVTSRTVKSEHESGLPRRLFQVTGLGQRALQVWQFAQSVMRLETA